MQIHFRVDNNKGMNHPMETNGDNIYELRQAADLNQDEESVV